MHKVIQLIPKFLHKKNISLSMKIYVHYMNLMKYQIIQNFQSLQIWKEKATSQKDFFLNHLIKELCSMHSKFLFEV
jgi:hypothetical protein